MIRRAGYFKVLVAVFVSGASLGACSSSGGNATPAGTGGSGGSSQGGTGGSSQGGTGGSPDGGGSVFSDRMCNTDFCWALPSPEGNTLYAVTATSDNDVWAVGGGGVFVHRASSSAAWQVAAAPVTQALLGVWADSDSDVWAVGDGGVTVHFDGSAFKVVPSGTKEPLYGVWGTAPDHIWAVGGYGSLLFYDGQKWTKQDQSQLEMHAVWGSSATDVWAVGGTGGVPVLAHWDGSSWTITNGGMGSAGLYAVSGTGPNDVWAAGEYGELFQLSANGAAFQGHIDQNEPTIDALHVTGPNDMLATSDSETYHYDGSQWSATDTANGALAMGAAPGSKAVWLAGTDGGIRQNGTQAGALTVSQPSAVWVRGDNDAFAINANGDVVHGDGTGAWNKIGTMPGTSDEVALGGTTDGTLLAAGTDNGTPVVKTYDGSTWNSLPALPTQASDGSPFSLYWPKLTGTSASDVLLVNNGDALVLQNGAWTTTSLPSALTDVEAVSEVGSTPWVVGTQSSPNQAYVARFDGTSWSQVLFSGADNVKLDAVWGKSANDVWVSGVFTDILKPQQNFAGVEYPTQPVVAHYDGNAWSRKPVPQPFANEAYNSAADAWISGTSDNQMWLVLAGDPQLAGNSYSWDGKAWTAKPCPAESLEGVWQTTSQAWVLAAGGLLSSR